MAPSELKIVLSEFLARYPNYRLSREPRCLRSFFVRGIKTLPVQLQPR